MLDHKALERDEISQGSREIEVRDHKAVEREMRDHKAVERDERSQGSRER